MAKKLKEEEVKQQQKRDNEAKEASSTENSKHKWGSILVDKIFEPLDTLLMAYESRLKSGEPMSIQWENYPDPELEKSKFSICKRLIEVTQKLVEKNQTKDKDETQQ